LRGTSASLIDDGPASTIVGSQATGSITSALASFASPLAPLPVSPLLASPLSISPLPASRLPASLLPVSPVPASPLAVWFNWPLQPRRAISAMEIVMCLMLGGPLRKT
jgi:hypothetical protein